MLIYLIRHGETDWNRDRRVMGTGPVPLNERGREMVGVLARFLKGDGIHAIYSSTVERAMETSRILAKEWDRGIVDEPRLNESAYDRWVGKTYMELRDDPEFKRYSSEPTKSRFSADESMSGIQQRVLGVIERIASEARAERVAAVSHSDVIKPLIAHVLRMDLDAMHRLAIANASVTLLNLRGERPRVVFMNVSPWKFGGRI